MPKVLILAGSAERVEILAGDEMLYSVTDWVGAYRGAGSSAAPASRFNRSFKNVEVDCGQWPGASLFAARLDWLLDAGGHLGDLYRADGVHFRTGSRP